MKMQGIILLCFLSSLSHPGNCQEKPHALFSVVLNGQKYFCERKVDSAHIAHSIAVKILEAKSEDQFHRQIISLQNISADTLHISNFVPFGADSSQIYITGLGDHPLSRAHLFIPGKIPVNVVLPDNAWELGFSIRGNGINDTCALARRDVASIKNGQRRRFETILYPGGSVNYNVWYAAFSGPWQEGLRLMFQQSMLFDVNGNFDNSLFRRADLQWIRHAYVMHLVMAWDKFFYDGTDKKFHLADFEKRGKLLYGSDDVIGIWPTWPSLGTDQRNQFDLFRDLPGGTLKLRSLADDLRRSGTKLFICYNPWDEDTRSEGHLKGIADIVRETSADGVVLDTKGESSRELQMAADKVRPGVIMYSEGQAVPKDMQGIVSGRVHNALYYVPMLNLNKFIKPEFAIFRVAELYKEPIQREFALSFFNGYGTELNIFAPGQPDWVTEQYRYLGKTSRILRENTENFTAGKYTPLINTTTDSIWVNKWEKGENTVYTIYSIRPAGYKGFLFEADSAGGSHFVDLWHHKLLHPKKENGKWLIEAETNAFHQKYLGTNNEGEVDCIAKLPVKLSVALNGDLLMVNTTTGSSIKIWQGAPSYEKTPVQLKPVNHVLHLNKIVGRFEGDLVIQLFDGNLLIDETVVTILPGIPRRVSEVTKTHLVNGQNTMEMVKIPEGVFKFNESHGDEFIPYPKQDVDSVFRMKSFSIDRYPVTNIQFRNFLRTSKYKPADTVRFLAHWVHGEIPKGMEQFPVVNISYEDAQAYAHWTGKRLPTEIEWQYAAQTEALNEWPWKQTVPVTRKEEVITETLTTVKLEGIDSTLCNLGNGKMDPVGKYPAGANPFGLQDLVGSVWQLTNDEYLNGSYRYIILKGGSYFKPSGSWWYVQGGPRELHYRQFLLRVSPGFERNATVGFRCVRD